MKRLKQLLLAVFCLAATSLMAQEGSGYAADYASGPRFRALLHYEPHAEEAHVEFDKQAIKFFHKLTYGEGFDYPLMDSFSSGPLTGEVPVGIRTIDDTDIPYWPQVNNACYKEVWTTSAGRFLSLVAEF